MTAIAKPLVHSKLNTVDRPNVGQCGTIEGFKSNRIAACKVQWRADGGLLVLGQDKNHRLNFVAAAASPGTCSVMIVLFPV